ncbi:alpha/beta-hydrolase [Rhizophagus irregularis]|uniref:Alpha/beta-hydrolase n=1 Tax=Rhizophagus irregularis TaxID=588596 RepID=A0A2N1NG52_9GLOM|nr:alpha/beta-hydrolase [Rhizophagus irregularis]
MAELIKFSPLLISTSIKHYLNGPPRPSWDLKFHLTWALYKSIFSYTSMGAKTIEQMQEDTFRPTPVQAGAMINEFKINNKYRHEAQVHLEKIFKPYEHVLDPEWRDLNDNEINNEWVQVPNDGWEKREIMKTILYLHGGGYYLCSKESHRNITSPIAKKADARILVINYRLAPQNQFPAALQDALAAYLYLLNPPKDAGFEPLNPKNIVISGDSAGGGLSLALGLAIRDAGLPSCAGITCWSPLVDLTHSTPSVSDDECIDFLPILAKGINHAESQVSKEFKEKAAALTAKIKKQNLGPKIWPDSFDKPDGRLEMYAPNEGLAIPYVSPMLAESLCNLPPLLLVAGDDERLRDEIIYFAHRSAEPTKYKGPSYNAGKFEKSPFQTPTNTTLEIYEEMLHVFQGMEHASTTKSYERTVEFINRVTNVLNEPLPPSSYNCINAKGEFGPLKEHHKKVLNWEKIGIVPNITRN